LTASWDDELAELRVLYLREASGRMDELDRLLDLLRRDGGDAAALQDLRRGFHAFSGSGATYGLPAVSALGLEAERLCTTVGEGPAVATDLKGWRDVVTALRGEFATATSTGAADAPEDSLAVERPLPSVFVVQEDPAEREALVRALTQESFSVRDVAGLEAAAAALDARLPDALVIDAAGDQAAAFALVERLRARPGGDRPVVLVVARHGGVLDRVEAIHCGADGHFTKPVDVLALVRRLRFLLEREGAEPPRILSVRRRPPAGGVPAHRADFGRLRVPGGRRSGAPGIGAGRLPSRPRAHGRPPPGVSGYDLVRSLRQDERYATLPVIVLTTQGELDARIEARARAGTSTWSSPSRRRCFSRRWPPASSAAASCASSSSATASPACSRTPRSWSAPAE
jgi:DNA-binding response OmpR family regulator